MIFHCRSISFILLFLNVILSSTELLAEKNTTIIDRGVVVPHDNYTPNADFIRNSDSVLYDRLFHWLKTDSVDSGDSDNSRSIFRLGAHVSANLLYTDLDYIGEQLEHYGASDLDSYFGINISVYLTQSNYYLELEWGVDWTSSNLDLPNGESNELLIECFSTGLWFRRGFHNVLKPVWDHAPPIDILPGISIDYSNAIVTMSTDIDDQHYKDQVLAGSGWGFSAGILVKFHFFFIEYRYRWKNLGDIWTSNGGDFFFPGDPELDFSGHHLGIGIGGSTNIYAKD